MRFRDLGVEVGTLPSGKFNAITDVEGVLVGHHTLNEGDDTHTGVTAILAHGGNLFTDKVTGAVHTINGFGKASGFEQVRELGTIETPILLTNTLNVGKVADASISYMLQDNPDLRSINPLVGECNDGYINNIHQRRVSQAHVFSALEQASSGRVAEGCVGAGTGTSCYGYKGGIGTASRLVGKYTVGVLMQTNFGRRDELTMLGVPIGYHLERGDEPDSGDGSVMIVIATDAPLTSRQLGRLATRASFGLGRTGTVCHHGSGDFVIAFSTKPLNQAIPDHQNNLMNGLFQGVVECVEESVYNALFMAETTQGYQGNTLYALNADTVRKWLKYYRRLG
ncbi:MAG: P1 family peptidase [Phototrophicaceae bacterium]